MLSREDIKKILEEKRVDKTNVTATVDRSKVKKLKELAKEHGVSFSALLEVCVDMGLNDPIINKKGGENK